MKKNTSSKTIILKNQIKEANTITFFNHIWESPLLSCKAKGVYIFLLSRENDSRFTEYGLTLYFKNGIGTIRNAIKELEFLGLLDRKILDDRVVWNITPEESQYIKSVF